MQQHKSFARFLRIVSVLAIAKQATALRAQDTSPRMDNIVQDYVQRKIFTGSILVARDGKIVFDKSYGSANLEWDIPNSPTTKFRIASLTKQIYGSEHLPSSGTRKVEYRRSGKEICS